MGYQMNAFMQKFENGEWVNIDILPRDKYEPDQVNICYCRDDVYNQKHWDWLGMSSYSVEWWGEEVPPHLTPKGLPDDIKPGSFEWECLNNENSVTWLLLDDLLATEWDLVYNFYNGELQQSLRTYLGQPFIDWLLELKRLEVERIVYAFG